MVKRAEAELRRKISRLSGGLPGGVSALRREADEHAATFSEGVHNGTE